MKRLTAILAAALVVLTPARGQDDKDIRLSRKETKEASKQAKAAEKLLRKEGFRTYDLGSVTANLEKYFTRAAEGCHRIVGTSGPCMSENLAKLTALANAANEYAVLQGGTVRGRIISSASSLSGQQIDNLVASFERLVEKEIRGELLPCASFFKERCGRFSARIYCIVDEKAAAQARRRAMEIAVAEQALADRYGTMVSDWVDEGFWKEGERN